MPLLCWLRLLRERKTNAAVSQMLAKIITQHHFCFPPLSVSTKSPFKDRRREIWGEEGEMKQLTDLVVVYGLENMRGRQDGKDDG